MRSQTRTRNAALPLIERAVYIVASTSCLFLGLVFAGLVVADLGSTPWQVIVYCLASWAMFVGAAFFDWAWTVDERLARRIAEVEARTERAVAAGPRPPYIVPSPRTPADAVTRTHRRHT